MSARQRVAAPVALGLLLVAAACARRPEFDVARARLQIAEAFGQQPAKVAIYDDGRGKLDDEWIVEFKIEGFGPFLQARFSGKNSAWNLRDVRERTDGVSDVPWVDLGVLIGRVRGESARMAEETMKRIKELAGLVERHAVDHHNRYPSVDLPQLQQLLSLGHYVGEWKYSTDAWGNALVYHASPDGQAYIIMSPGADSKWDQDVATYFANTDRGIEAYGGVSSNADRDILYASGGFVQSFEPGG